MKIEVMGTVIELSVWDVLALVAVCVVIIVSILAIGLARTVTP